MKENNEKTRGNQGEYREGKPEKRKQEKTRGKENHGPSVSSCIALLASVSATFHCLPTSVLRHCNWPVCAVCSSDRTYDAFLQNCARHWRHNLSPAIRYVKQDQ